MNPNNEMDLKRLRNVLKRSRSLLEPFRRHHTNALKDYVGIFYSDDGAEKSQPINVLELAVNIFSQHLIGRPPQVNVFTRDVTLKSSGAKLESVMNGKLREKNLDIYRVLRRAVKNALFSIGIVKVCRKVSGGVDYEGYRIDRMEPYVKGVSLDDWVHDMTAKTWEQIAYAGHRYSIPLEDARENPSFDKKLREELQQKEWNWHNESGDERPGAMSGQSVAEDAAYEKMIDLWEIYLPKEKLLVTLPWHHQSQPLRVVEWEGPECGPFHQLFFNEVDGNTMPLSPMMLWRGLHDLINGLFRKMERGSNRGKTIGLVRGEDTEDADRIRQANDGDVIGVTNTDAVKEAHFGGVNQQDFAFFMQSKQLFSWINGNLDTLGGLAAGADTAAQDKLMAGNAGQRVQHMQEAVHLFTMQVLDAFGWFLWDDPLESYEFDTTFGDVYERETGQSYGGEDFAMTDYLEAEERDHPFDKHQVTIEPYSMTFHSPQERLQMLTATMTQEIMPALQLLTQQGIVPDFRKYLQLKAKYANLPELAEILNLAGPEEKAQLQALGAGGGGLGGGKPASTTRQYDRVSSAGASGPGQEQQMIGRMMAATQQGAA